VKSPLTPVHPPAARFILAALVAVLLGLAALPVATGPGVGLLVMDLLSPLCHQLRDRSFHVAGVQMGLCHRCTGILSGMAFALLLPLAPRRSVSSATLLGVALLPVALDWSIDAAGIWANTTASRLLTGLWAGTVIGLLVGRAAATDEGWPPGDGPRP